MESAEEARELSQKFGYELVPGFTASKILWLKRREPEHFARLRHVLLVCPTYAASLTVVVTKLLCQQGLNATLLPQESYKSLSLLCLCSCSRMTTSISTSPDGW